MKLADLRRYLATLGDQPTQKMLGDAGEMLWGSLEEAAQCAAGPPGNTVGARTRNDPWESLEVLAWHHGEAVSRYLLGVPLVRGDNALLDVCARIALDGRFGRGRQNFVGVLGLFGGRSYGDELASLLPDTQVFGHVVGALRRAGLEAYAAEAIMHCPRGPALWVKIVLLDYVQFCASHP